MKNSKKFIILTVVLVIILIAAAFLYPKLAEKYGKDEEPAPKGETSASAGEEKTAVTDGKTEKNEGNTEANSEKTETATAPDFEVLDAGGETVRLSDNYGERPIVVNFWATWCPYCVMEFPEFEKCAGEYGDEIAFMMVDLTDGRRETVEDATAYIEENGYTFPVYFDTQFSAVQAYGVSGIPMTVFIDRDGNVLDEHVGAMDGETLREYIDMLIGGDEK